MRPRFADQEITFLLELLREIEAIKKRQIQSLSEEAEHLHRRVPASRYKSIYESPFKFGPQLRENRKRLQRIEFEWLPAYSKQDVALKGLIIRLEKILSHRRGRIPHDSIIYGIYLAEINKMSQKNPKTLSLHIHNSPLQKRDESSRSPRKACMRTYKTFKGPLNQKYNLEV